MTDPRWGGNPNLTSSQAFPCGGCGARLQFAPGTTVLQCPYCGFQQQITAGDAQVREIAFEQLTVLPRKPVGTIADYVLTCRGCGAQTQTNEIASNCQFCKAPVVVDANATGQIVPEGVLPFALDRNGLRTALRGWATSRWFAPTALKKVSEVETTRGTYIPHWTFDAQTTTQYFGQRGIYYYETETYVDSDGNTQTRQARRTRWYDTSGQVSRFFDDVLVPGSVVVPPKKLDELGPWPLQEVVPYQGQFLAGYHGLRYDIEPETSFEEAKRRMATVIEDDCKHDIGGDTQRVAQADTAHQDVTFKLLQLPVWMATYVYAGKNWQILVNGRTGEILGERPYSTPKIVLAVIMGLIVLGLLIFLYLHFGHHGAASSTSHGTVHTTTKHH